MTLAARGRSARRRRQVAVDGLHRIGRVGHQRPVSAVILPELTASLSAW